MSKYKENAYAFRVYSSTSPEHVHGPWQLCWVLCKQLFINHITQSQTSSCKRLNIVLHYSRVRQFKTTISHYLSIAKGGLWQTAFILLLQRTQILLSFLSPVPTGIPPQPTLRVLPKALPSQGVSLLLVR